jgi:hypothetical protein
MAGPVRHPRVIGVDSSLAIGRAEQANKAPADPVRKTPLRVIEFIGIFGFPQ